MTVSKDGKSYYASLEIVNVTVEDAGKYRVTAKNELGESNATISLNFDSKYIIKCCTIIVQITSSGQARPGTLTIQTKQNTCVF